MNEEALSSLVDGELSSDDLNEVLLEVIDDDEARSSLREHLRLRQAMGAWRTQTPEAAPDVGEGAPETLRITTTVERTGFRYTSLAIAAGIVILLGASFFFGRGFSTPTSESAWNVAMRVDDAEEIFEMHEAIAGPVDWYAESSDDSDVSFASEATSRAPVVVFLGFGSPEDGEALQCMLICRDGQEARVEFQATGDRPGMRLTVSPTLEGETVRLRYSIEVRGDDAIWAGIGGEESIGTERRLGRLDLAGRVLDVKAVGAPLNG